MQRGSAIRMLVAMATLGMSVMAAADEPSFNRDIRPILAENCFQCHGPDAKKREADLRLDTSAGAISTREGVAAIVPGDAAASELLARVTASDPDERMPPLETDKRLSDEQIELLRRWIAAGAKYERHWAFEPVKRPPLPAIGDSKNAAWSNNPIDQFIAAKLEQHELSPSPQADRYTLIRRVYLDLLGLPPSIDEVDAFVNDPRPDAYEQLVGRVLASPRFGERWGRHWLDQARYADSHGYTNDNERSIWPYRDWVISAINRDLPFNQFTIEQLAGDLLPQATQEQLVATGFHRNTLINTEGGTKADQFRDEQVKDRVDTTTGVWLALTAGCAKCHDHKYDPISQAEYYQLYAFLNSTADENSVTPTIKAPSSQQQERLAELNARHGELTRLIAADSDRAARQQSWEAALVQRAKEEAEAATDEKSIWTVLPTDGKSALAATVTAQEDRSLLVTGNNGDKDEYQATGRSPLTTIRSVRLEALTHEKLPHNGPGRAANGNFVLSEIWFRTGDGRELRFMKAFADHSQPDNDIAGAIDGQDNTGWAVNGSPEGGPNHNRTAWFVLPQPLTVEEGHALTFIMQFNTVNAGYGLGRFRISISPEVWVDSPSVAALAKLAAIPAGERSKPQQLRLDEAFLKEDAKLGPTFAELQAVTRQQDELVSQIPTTMVLSELAKPRPAHVQIRGDFLRRGDAVGANVPAVLPAMAGEINQRTRLDLARWLVRPDNPLTPRVQVNRIWMRLFGAGLVETENDFGTQGSLPTHPELLDWLADEYVRQGWSAKAMLRLMVTSATYRQKSIADCGLRIADFDEVGAKSNPQSAIRNPQLIDPNNRLLWRQNRVRVEAEVVRDLALAAGGMLSDKLGGPSVFPPQPSGVYAFTQREQSWRTSTGEDRYRRGMYTFFYRSAPHPMLATFDVPSFNQSCTRRDRSNTPLQSLTVANDAAMFEMAQALARRTLSEVAKEDAARVDCMFRICLARRPTAAERDFLTQFLASQRQHFALQKADAKTLAPADLPGDIPLAEAAAWVSAARVLLNLDEFITRE